MALRARVVLHHAWLACPGVQRSFRASFPVGDKTCTRGRQKCIFFGVMLPKMLHNRRCFTIDGQYLLLDTVSYLLLDTVSSACRRCNARWDRDPRDCRAAARAGRKSLLEMRLVQLKGLHRSILRQIPLPRLAQVDITTDFFPWDVAEAPFSSDQARVICTGRHSDRFFGPGASRRPAFLRVSPPRLAQVDIPTDRLPPCRPPPRPVCASPPIAAPSSLGFPKCLFVAEVPVAARLPAPQGTVRPQPARHASTRAACWPAHLTHARTLKDNVSSHLATRQA